MNRLLEALREGNKNKLIIGVATSPTISAHQSSLVSMDIGINKLLLKSIEVTCSKQTDFRVEFFEESTQLNSRYNSGIVNAENYDVLDLPYMDKEESNKMYFLISNESDFDALYNLEIRGIEMR